MVRRIIDDVTEHISTPPLSAESLTTNLFVRLLFSVHIHFLAVIVTDQNLQPVDKSTSFDLRCDVIH
jgi:hypothetical protein